MPFLDAQSGVITIAPEVCLEPHMPKSRLLALLDELGGHATQGDANGVLLFPPCPVLEGVLAPICILEEERLCVVSFSVVEVGSKAIASAELQRAFLCRCFAMKDPYPDTLKNSYIQCSFGSLMLCTEPHHGVASAFIEYQ